MGEKLTATAEIIDHKGVQILLNDFSSLKGQELADALKAISQVMAPKIANTKDWLSISLFTNCLFDEAATKVLIRVHKGMIDHFLAMAEVGLNPTQKKGLELVHSVAKSSVPLAFLDTLEEAKDWVIEVYRKNRSKKLST